MSDQSSTVLITGAAGNVAEAAIEALAPRHELILADRVAHRSMETRIVDVADYDAVLEVMPVGGTVIHLGAIPDEAEPEQIFANNIRGTFNIFEAARARGARRVVFASSAMVYWGYGVENDDGASRPTEPLSPLRHCWPTTHYACSKLYAENLGRMFSTRHGLSAVGIRLGWYPRPPVNPIWFETKPHILISHGDAMRMFTRCVEAEGVDYVIINGHSRCGEKFFDVEPGRSVLGYDPRDDAAEAIRSHKKRLNMP